VVVSAENHVENDQILIENQNITDSVICGNVVTTVRNKSVLVSLINPTEEIIRIRVPNLNQLSYEKFHEASIYSVQVRNQTENPASNSRIS